VKRERGYEGGGESIYFLFRRKESPEAKFSSASQLVVFKKGREELLENQKGMAARERKGERPKAMLQEDAKLSLKKRTTPLSLSLEKRGTNGEKEGNGRDILLRVLRITSNRVGVGGRVNLRKGSSKKGGER